MKVLNDSEETEYARFMDALAIIVFAESAKAIKQFNAVHADATLNSVEIGMAMGQVALDKVIEMTKDMDRDKLVRILSEVSIAHVVSAMQENPKYRMRVAILSGLF